MAKIEARIGVLGIGGHHGASQGYAGSYRTSIGEAAQVRGDCSAAPCAPIVTH